MSEQIRMGFLAPDDDGTGPRPLRVWTLDELEPYARAAWPDLDEKTRPATFRARVFDAMMVISGFPPKHVTPDEQTRILAAYNPAA